MTSLRLQIIEDALKHAGSKCNRKGSTIKAQCPAHDDHKESLSISKTEQGKILINCFAGCRTEEILDELGLTFNDLFPDQSKGKNSMNKGSIVAKYDYTDKHGDLVFQTVRFQPKEFRQRQPKTNGEWQWNLEGVEPVIYNLPQVKSHINQDKPVFLVEGEKDADAIINRELCATTAPMGANKWKSRYNKFFRDAELIILPDNDTPGKKHALAACKELIGITKNLHILLLPNLNEKEDVSDWFDRGGTREKLLELAFETEPISSIEQASALLNLNTETSYKETSDTKKQFFENNLKIYSNDEEERVIADFNIEIQSIVKDDQEGRIFYIQIIEMVRGRRRVSEPIEIKPKCLDNKRSFYKAIRPYSMGEIKRYRNNNTKPLNIFKWLVENFDKPVVRRPDHLGFIKANNQRPFWLFGNALICPPWKENEGEIIHPNEADEFVINDRQGFALPLYESDAEKEQITPEVDTNMENIETLVGEVKTKLIHLIGGGDPSGRAKNYGKLLLAYIIYHLYEDNLFYANDMTGHSIIFYVFGPKGTGKTTYFNTILRAFFGLEKTKAIKGNSVSVPALENMMSMYSQMPVCYDEYNPEASDISYEHINSYYHKSSRSVSDQDRRKRNKFINIRSTFSITSNYRINLDIDQADATWSRAIYFQFKKEYRSEDQQLFDWFQNNLHRLSAITVHLLLTQTDEKREKVETQATKLFTSFKSRLEAINEENSNKYEMEHRLTDNYTRLLACYEVVFGDDENLREFTEQELLRRFEAAKVNDAEHTLINDMTYLASSGKLKEAWHYNYNNNQEELYIDLNQCYKMYENHKREEAVSKNKFKEVLKEYFDQYGGYETDSKRWSGKYFDKGNDRVKVDKVQHSYILTYKQVKQEGNQLMDMFRPRDEHKEVIKGMDTTKMNEVPI